MLRSPLPLAAAALALFCLVSPPRAALAQTGSTGPAAGSSVGSSDISDEKLDKAAAAIEQVARLHYTYEQKMAQTPPEQRDKLAEEANNALQKAVTDQGLTVNEYNSIVQVAQADPQVREKIMQRIPALRAPPDEDEQEQNDEEMPGSPRDCLNAID